MFIHWRKSTKSLHNQCLEVGFAHDSTAIGVRDTKAPTQEILAFERRHWTSFLTSLKAGTFDT